MVQFLLKNYRKHQPGDNVIIREEDGKSTFKAIFNKWLYCKFKDSGDQYSCNNCNGYMNITVCGDGEVYNECSGYTGSKLSAVEKIIKNTDIKPLKDSMFKI